MEYDKQGEELDSEKARAINLERQLDDLTRQLQVSSQQVSSVFVSGLSFVCVTGYEIMYYYQSVLWIVTWNSFFP